MSRLDIDKVYEPDDFQGIVYRGLQAVETEAFMEVIANLYLDYVSFHSGIVVVRWKDTPKDSVA